MKYEVVTATCPGFAPNQVDWRGCGTDARLVAEKREDYSSVWADALNIEESQDVSN